MAQREEEADTEGALPVVHQLAGGVVDRGDVVSVERVPQPQCVGGQSNADSEDFVAEAEVLRCDEHHQRDPADEVQARDDAEHRRQPQPFLRVSAASKRVKP